MKRKYLYTLIWFAFIVYASLSPANELPKFTFPHFDKLIHFCMYFGLAFLLIPIVFKKNTPMKSDVLAFILAAFTGVLFELLQLLLANGRTASGYDEMANMIGALAGILIYRLMIRNRKIEKILFKIE